MKAGKGDTVAVFFNTRNRGSNIFCNKVLTGTCGTFDYIRMRQLPFEYIGTKPRSQRVI